MTNSGKLTVQKQKLLKFIASKDREEVSLALGSDILTSFSVSMLSMVKEEGLVDYSNCVGDTRYWLTDRGKESLKQYRKTTNFNQ